MDNSCLTYDKVFSLKRASVTSKINLCEESLDEVLKLVMLMIMTICCG